MAVTIRRATLDDLDVLMELRAEVAAEGVWIGAELPLDVEGDRTRFAATIEAQADGCTDVMYVAELDDGSVVGNLSMHQRAGIATLGMNVSLHHRGAGIGVALMAAAVEWARRTGAHKVELERWPWNEPARRLYERFGFVEEGYRRRQYRRKDGSLWDSVLMGLVLDHEAPGHEIRPAEPPR